MVNTPCEHWIYGIDSLTIQLSILRIIFSLLSYMWLASLEKYFVKVKFIFNIQNDILPFLFGLTGLPHIVTSVSHTS